MLCKKKYTNYTASLLIGLLSLAIFSSCLQTGRTLGINQTNNKGKNHSTTSPLLSDQSTTSRSRDAECGRNMHTNQGRSGSTLKTKTRIKPLIATIGAISIIGGMVYIIYGYSSDATMLLSNSTVVELGTNRILTKLKSLLNHTDIQAFNALSLTYEKIQTILETIKDYKTKLTNISF